MSGIEELISAHLDGELDDDGQRRLDEWLGEDPEHQRRFLRAVIEHRALRERFAAERARPAPARRRRRAPIAMGVPAGLLAAAALALAIGGAWWASRPAPVPRLATPEPLTTPVSAVAEPTLIDARGVNVLRDGARIASTAQAALRRGDRVTIDGDGDATLRYADGTVVNLAGGTEVVIADSGAGKRLELAQGRLAAVMAAQPAGHPALIVTAEAQITVVGTALAVARTGAETAAEVTHGRVSVTSRTDGATVAVAAGECAAVAAGLPLRARPLGAPAGATYAVGTGLAYATLGALPTLAPGDLVEVHAGTYREARSWRAHGTALRPIVIRGVGSEPPVIDGDGVSVSGVGAIPGALFQIEGDHYLVEGLSFVNARNGENGAGIRCVGAVHAAIRRCSIARCDDGIVSGDEIDDLLIEDCDVGWIGTPEHEGLCHGIYIGGAHAVARGCRIHDTLHGQGLKSSCRRLELVANRIVGAEDGEISLIDGPGTAGADSAVGLIGNLVASKPERHGNSRRFVEVCSEAGGVRGGTLTLSHNTFVAADARIQFIDTERAAMRVVADANVFVGSDRIALLGSGGLTGHGNWLPQTASEPPGIGSSYTGPDPGFVAADAGDYRPRRGGALDDATLDHGVGAPAVLAPAQGPGTVPRRIPLTPGCFDPAR